MATWRAALLVDLPILHDSEGRFYGGNHAPDHYKYDMDDFSWGTWSDGLQAIEEFDWWINPHETQHEQDIEMRDDMVVDAQYSDERLEEHVQHAVEIEMQIDQADHSVVNEDTITETPLSQQLEMQAEDTYNEVNGEVKMEAGSVFQPQKEVGEDVTTVHQSEEGRSEAVILPTDLRIDPEVESQDVHESLCEELTAGQKPKEPTTTVTILPSHLHIDLGAEDAQQSEGHQTILETQPSSPHPRKESDGSSSLTELSETPSTPSAESGVNIRQVHSNIVQEALPAQQPERDSLSTPDAEAAIASSPAWISSPPRKVDEPIANAIPNKLGSLAEDEGPFPIPPIDAMISDTMPFANIEEESHPRLFTEPTPIASGSAQAHMTEQATVANDDLGNSSTNGGDEQFLAGLVEAAEAASSSDSSVSLSFRPSIPLAATDTTPVVTKETQPTTTVSLPEQLSPISIDDTAQFVPAIPDSSSTTQPMVDFSMPNEQLRGVSSLLSTSSAQFPRSLKLKLSPLKANERTLDTLPPSEPLPPSPYTPTSDTLLETKLPLTPSNSKQPTQRKSRKRNVDKKEEEEYKPGGISESDLGSPAKKKQNTSLISKAGTKSNVNGEAKRKTSMIDWAKNRAQDTKLESVEGNGKEVVGLTTNPTIRPKSHLQKPTPISSPPPPSTKDTPESATFNSKAPSQYKKTSPQQDKHPLDLGYGKRHTRADTRIDSDNTYSQTASATPSAGEATFKEGNPDKEILAHTDITPKPGPKKAVAVAVSRSKKRKVTLPDDIGKEVENAVKVPRTTKAEKAKTAPKQLPLSVPSPSSSDILHTTAVPKPTPAPVLTREERAKKYGFKPSPKRKPTTRAAAKLKANTSTPQASPAIVLPISTPTPTPAPAPAPVPDTDTVTKANKVVTHQGRSRKTVKTPAHTTDKLEVRQTRRASAAQEEIEEANKVDKGETHQTKGRKTVKTPAQTTEKLEVRQTRRASAVLDEIKAQEKDKNIGKRLRSGDEKN